MKRAYRKLNMSVARNLIKPWNDLARKNKNVYVGLYDKNHRKLGFIEQGKDGFTEIIIKCPYFMFTKAWLYPPADKNGWVKAQGLLRKKC